MNLLLIIFGILLLLLLVILLYPVQYRMHWEHEADTPHKLEFRIVFLSGLFGMRFLMTGLQRSVQFIIVGQPQKKRKTVFKKRVKEAEEPDSVRGGVSGKVKKARHIMRKFTRQEIIHIIRTALVHLWRWIRPHRYNVDLTYGFGNPMYTGELYGILWATRILPSEFLDISANYTAAELTGHANIYGNLSIGGIFWRTFAIAMVAGKILFRKKFQLSPILSNLTS